MFERMLTVTNAEGEILGPPASRDGVDITAANTASRDLDVNILILLVTA